ncbi:hypothetical protein [Streptomyces sp. NPDC001348]
MAPSPWRRRRKPRHARPRTARLACPCLPCLADWVELALGPVGHLLGPQQPGHWLNTAGTVALLGLRTALRHSGHNPNEQRK